MSAHCTCSLPCEIVEISCKFFLPIYNMRHVTTKKSPVLCLPEAVAVSSTLLQLCTTEVEQIVVYEEAGMWEEGKISLCVKISNIKNCLI